MAEALRPLPTIEFPWAGLATCHGWVLWLGHPPVPELGMARLLPAPPELIWDGPRTALATAAAAALAYARRRGAAEPAAIEFLLRRECPVAIVVPDEVDSGLRELLAEVEGLGVPLLFGAGDGASRLAAIPAFKARAIGHEVSLGREHDPALADPLESVVETIGGDSLSSYVLHHEGERDGVRVTGEPSSRFAVEVGVRGAGIGLAETAALEASAAEYAGFLAGVTSGLDERGHGLLIGWAAGMQPSPTAIGGALRAWLIALDSVHLVDVRIVFAPAAGRSARLADMRARATAFTQHRAAVARGEEPADRD